MPPQPLLTADETSRRARAAPGYSLKEARVIEDLVSAKGVTPASFKRIIAKTNARPASVEELWAIADACGVPRRFMEEGFAPLNGAGNLEDRVSHIEAQLEELRREGVARDLEDAEQRQRGAGTGAREAGDQDDPQEGVQG